MYQIPWTAAATRAFIGVGAIEKPEAGATTSRTAAASLDMTTIDAEAICGFRDEVIA